jgi:rhodanese-related sulfurtransferase
MKLPLFLALVTLTAPVLAQDNISNPLIDYEKFENIVVESSQERESRRLTEEQFIAMLNEGDIVLLDARSESRYALRHVKGAINLYCNNNFEGSPTSFAEKAPAASLNLSTYNSLKAYGYNNIFELGPLLDISTTKIPFEGTEVSSR